MPTRLRVSVLMPVYRGSAVLPQALASLASQRFPVHEVIVSDDTPPDDLGERNRITAILRGFPSLPLRSLHTETNIGSARNIRHLAEEATGDVLFFLCQDDLLSRDALRRTHDMFLRADDVGFVTRPFLWFDNNIRRPIRAVTPYDERQDALLSIRESKRAFLKVFETVGQISGLAYRRAALTVPFGEDTFPGHIYPAAGILRDHRCVFLKDYTVAVRLRTSQARLRPDIYTPPPALSWMRMYDRVFAAEEDAQLRAWGYEHIGTNDVGLFQVKNYGPPGALSRELRVLLRHYPPNRLRLRFWSAAAVASLLPRFLLRPLADAYKTTILALRLRHITFELPDGFGEILRAFTVQMRQPASTLHDSREQVRADSEEFRRYRDRG